jgi:hypothetical protein
MREAGWPGDRTIRPGRALEPGEAGVSEGVRAPAYRGVGLNHPQVACPDNPTLLTDLAERRQRHPLGPEVQAPLRDVFRYSWDDEEASASERSARAPLSHPSKGSTSGAPSW